LDDAPARVSDVYGFAFAGEALIRSFKGEVFLSCCRDYMRALPHSAVTIAAVQPLEGTQEVLRHATVCRV
jgi:hypothetical protein